uniref:DOMON domain-containing protein n=1 Tax=Oryza punctata TaxID=4537 RepID=A0A0E0M302_ORYPU
MASSVTHLRAVLLAVALLVASPAATAAASVCKGEKFPAGRSYATCADLPALGATLHWTYDGKASTLSLAFVAKLPASGGWVSWAINPTGDGMKGAQALVAFKGGAGAASYVVNTYNVTGYKPFPAAATPIAFNTTDLAADENAATGKVQLYGKLQLPHGMETVNHIWQVGSTVTGGVPMKHAFAKENLDAKGRLSLTGNAVAQEPAPAPVAGGPSAEAENAVTAASPSPSGKNAAATTHTSAPAALVAVLALAGFLAFV